MTSKGFIDSHMHVVTQRYTDAVNDAGGDPSHYPMPGWTFEGTMALMDKLNIQHSILSVTTPGASIAGAGKEGRQLARELNDEVASIVGKSGGRFNFFASLPDFTDVEGTLAEIDYVFGQQKKAVGVLVMSSYGDRLLGDEKFKPIWESLNKYKAIVFIHPTYATLQPTFIAGWLPQPFIDFPQSTTRAAVDLLLTGRFQECPDIDIILSHAGGTLPYISTRLFEILNDVIPPGDSQITRESAMRTFDRFYYDTALSGTPTQLDAFTHMKATDRLLFGSDFPYASESVATAFTKGLNDYIATSPNGQSISQANLSQNSIRLFKKHGFDLVKE